MNSSTAPSSPLSLHNRHPSIRHHPNQRAYGRHSERHTSICSEYGASGFDRYRYHKSAASSMTSIRTAEENLDDDNPEDRRIAAALLRRHVTFEDQRYDENPLQDTLSVDTTAPPSKRSCRLSVMTSEPEMSPHGLSYHEGLSDPETKDGTDSHLLDDGASSSVSAPAFSSFRSRSGTSTTGSKNLTDDEDETDTDSAHRTVGKSLSEGGYSGMFWGELEGLKEENSALRHDNEVHRLRGQVTGLKLQLQELTSLIYYQTAFGVQSYQIDRHVQEVIDDVWCQGVRCLEDVFDIPAFVFEYVMKEASSGTVGPSTEMQALTSDVEALTISGLQSNSPRSCDCGCGHDYRCSVIGLSRAAEFLTGRFLREERGTSWRTLFVGDSPADARNILQVRRWLDDIETRLQNVDVTRDPSSLIEEQESTELLTPLRLRHKSGRLISGSMLFTSFLIANRFLIIGVHSACVQSDADEPHISGLHSLDGPPGVPFPHRSQHLRRGFSAYNRSEIRVRKNLISLLGRIASTAIERLKFARRLLGRRGSETEDFKTEAEGPSSL